MRILKTILLDPGEKLTDLDMKMVRETELILQLLPNLGNLRAIRILKSRFTVNGLATINRE